jgi:hypothetical protein
MSYLELAKRVVVRPPSSDEACNRSAADKTCAPWDQAAADAVLGELRAEVTRICTEFGGAPPAPLDGLLSDAIAIGERYVREHELEAARGWDPLELLRDLVPFVRDLPARRRATKATEATKVTPCRRSHAEQIDAPQ